MREVEYSSRFIKDFRKKSRGIYRKFAGNERLVLERLGSHAEIFGM